MLLFTDSYLFYLIISVEFLSFCHCKIVSLLYIIFFRELNILELFLSYIHRKQVLLHMMFNMDGYLFYLIIFVEFISFCHCNIFYPLDLIFFQNLQVPCSSTNTYSDTDTDSMVLLNNFLENLIPQYSLKFRF